MSTSGPPDKPVKRDLFINLTNQEMYVRVCKLLNEKQKEGRNRLLTQPVTALIFTQFTRLPIVLNS